MLATSRAQEPQKYFVMGKKQKPYTTLPYFMRNKKFILIAIAVIRNFKDLLKN